jgi:preprotein translocase subunit SecD
MGRQRLILAFILALTLVAIGIIVKVPARLGLDLQGGSQLTLQVKTTEAVREIDANKLAAVQQVVENRINGLGVAEAIVQPVPDRAQLLIQLPGVSDPDEAERVLGGTAQLDFRQQRAGTEFEIATESQELLRLRAEREALIASDDRAKLEENQAAIDKAQESIAQLFDKTGLTGDRLTDAQASPLGGNAWQVVITFDHEGGEQFAEITKNLAGTGRGLGIFLDNDLLSAPRVDAKDAVNGITGGSASITGGFDAQSARELEVQLRGGALPVPVEVVENRTIGATLGRDSIQSSIYAGLAGLALVLIFMVVYYRLPGLIADIALVIYALLTFAIFTVLGVTLTLPGIAGFISASVWP